MMENDRESLLNPEDAIRERHAYSLRGSVLAWSAAIGAVFLLGLSLSFFGRAPHCSCDPAALFEEHLHVTDAKGVSHWFPYHCNSKGALDIGGESFQEAVIVLHGATRNAAEYFCAMDDARCHAFAFHALIIAPHFLHPNDETALGKLMWDPKDMDGAWRYGDDAINAANVSSFDVLDQMVRQLHDARLFPKLRRITVAGHSSGGQLSQRFALVSHHGAGPHSEEGVAPARASRDVNLRFVVANPSSYAYLSPARYNATTRQVALPSPEARASCPGFNQWRFGLEVTPSSPRYVRQISLQGVVPRYLGRDVVYLLGEQDDCETPGDNTTAGAHPEKRVRTMAPAPAPSPKRLKGTGPPCNSRGLETTCADELQGPNRLNRGYNFVAALTALRRWLSPQEGGSKASSRHRLVVVKGVGHDFARMFASEEGREALFK
eukprot:jgi/Mesvir1/16413/Mv18148-RA.1